MRIIFTKERGKKMEFKANDVNAEVISDNSCKKTTKVQYNPLGSNW